MSNSISDKDLENTVISICRDSGVEIDPKDIKGCLRLPLSRNSRGQDKRVIVEFVNQKQSIALLRDQKWISSKSFNHLNVPNNIFVSVSLCSYYRYIWGKCKNLLKMWSRKCDTKFDIDELQQQKIPNKEKSVFFHINSCSLNKNFEELQNLLQSTNIQSDVIAITKTWITKNTSVTQILN